DEDQEHRRVGRGERRCPVPVGCEQLAPAHGGGMSRARGGRVHRRRDRHCRASFPVPIPTGGPVAKQLPFRGPCVRPGEPGTGKSCWIGPPCNDPGQTPTDIAVGGRGRSCGSGGGFMPPVSPASRTPGKPAYRDNATSPAFAINRSRQLSYVALRRRGVKLPNRPGRKQP